MVSVIFQGTGRVGVCALSIQAPLSEELLDMLA